MSSETSRDTALPFARMGAASTRWRRVASSFSAARRVTSSKPLSRSSSVAASRAPPTCPATRRFSARSCTASRARSLRRTRQSPRNELAEWPPRSPRSPRSTRSTRRPHVAAPFVSRLISEIFVIVARADEVARSAANAGRGDRSRSRCARAALAAHFSLAILTRTFMASSETSRVRRDQRRLHPDRAPRRTRRASGTAGDERRSAEAGVARQPRPQAGARLDALGFDGQDEQLEPQHQRALGSGVEDDAASVSSPSLRAHGGDDGRLSEEAARGSRTPTRRPSSPPRASPAVGSANRETRPAQELVVKKAGCVFTSATTARARASTWPARERSPASSASSARVDALRCAKASIVTDAGDQRRERPHRARLRVVGDVYCDDAGPRTEVAKRVPSRAATSAAGSRRRSPRENSSAASETWPAVETLSAPKIFSGPVVTPRSSLVAAAEVVARSSRRASADDGRRRARRAARAHKTAREARRDEAHVRAVRAGRSGSTVRGGTECVHDGRGRRPDLDERARRCLLGRCRDRRRGA